MVLCFFQQTRNRKCHQFCVNMHQHVPNGSRFVPRNECFCKSACAIVGYGLTNKQLNAAHGGNNCNIASY